MKLRLKITALAVLIFVCAGFFTSCGYMTRNDVKSMLDEYMLGNVTVNGGNNNNITINNNNEAGNTLAAAKGLLSSVSIVCDRALGSGVIYRLNKEKGDAYVITNYHVVYEPLNRANNYISNSIYLYLYGQENSKYAIKAEYVGGSMQYDLAVLKVKSSAVLCQSNAVAAEFANSDEISLLETAIAIGNAAGEGISVTSGCVNVDSEDLEMYAADDSTVIKLRVMRIDTAVNSGNSGGGLFNYKGEIIGIVNAKLKSADNISYAIPSNVAKYVADNIVYYCDGTDKISPYRCMIGISVTPAELYTVYDTETGKIHKMERVSVSLVKSGGPADGVLKLDDVINSITIDGTKYEVNRVFNVVDSMLNARVGSKVIINITRGDTTMDVEMEIDRSALTEWK